MLYKDIARILSLWLFGLSGIFLIPLSIAFHCEFIAQRPCYPQNPTFMAFVWTMITTAGFGGLLYYIGRKSQKQFYRKEALLLVLLFYISTSFFGSLPFLFSKTLDNPIDAFFETTSGLTTTGASIIEAKRYDKNNLEIPIVETFITGQKKTYTYNGTVARIPNGSGSYLEGLYALAPSLLFWRNFTQFLGGGGIVVLFVAILPMFGVGGKLLFESEMTGPRKESFSLRIKEAASNLWKTYLGLTILQIILLLLTNFKMPLLDAILLSFSTISTGGFAVADGNIAVYNNIWTEIILMIFMILGSINFSLYFFFIKRKFLKLNDPELKLFLTLLILGSLFATWQLMGQPIISLTGQANIEKSTFWEAVRYGSFQVISTQTTTGLAISDYDTWPFSLQTLLFILVFIGGMAGSTAGGIKIIRLQMFFRILSDKLETIFRPDTIRSYRVGGGVIETPLAVTVLCFLMVVATFTIIGTFLLTLNAVDPETSLTTIGSMLNNSGLAFRMGSPQHSFAYLSSFGKLLSCFCMIAGRLEFFLVLLVLTPSFWKKM